MKDLDEKIYEMLEECNDSLTISEIASKFKNIEKKEITSKLQDMNRQGIVFRSLRDGKACYSINENQGEGRNASQENINNINRVLLSMNSKKKLTSGTDILGNVEILNKLKLGFINFDSTNLKYSKHCIYENENYRMEIPDNFVYLPNEDNRDFVAYLPKKNIKLPYEQGGAHITIYSSTLTSIPTNVERIEETKRLLYDLSYWTGGIDLVERFGGKPEYKDVKLNCGRTALIYMKFDTAHNFYFTCYFKKNMKQMRIVIDSINGTKEELEKIAISIMNKFIIKEKIGDLDELDDKKYLVKNLDENTISEWVENLIGVYKSINEYYQILTEIELSKAKVLKIKDNFNNIKFKAEVREELKEYRDIIEKYIEKTEIFFKYAVKNTIDVNLLIPAYYWLKRLLEIKEISMDMEDGSKITEKIKLAYKIENELFNKDVLKLIESYDYKETKRIEKSPIENLQINKELEEYCNDFIKQSKKILSRYRRDWENTLEDYQDGLNSKIIKTEYELKWEIKNIKQAAMTKGDQYDDFLTEVDKEAKKILKQGAYSEFIKEINNIVKETFHAIEDLDLSFNTRGSYYLDKNSFEYDIPSELYDIENYWKNEYENHPEVKAIKEKERLKKEQRNENVKKDLAELKKDIQNESKVWKEEIKNIKAELEKKKQEVNIRNSNEKKERLEKLLNDKNNIIKELSIEIEKLANNNKENESEIETLGFLKFIKKDKLKLQIDINNQNIEKYKEKIEIANKDYEMEYNKILKDSQNKLNNEISNLDKTYRFPEKPDAVFNKITSILEKRKLLKKYIENKETKFLTKNQIENEKIKKEILKTLVMLDRPITITEIQSFSRECDRVSCPKLSAILEQMISNKLVVKMVNKKKIYFYANDGSTFEDNIFDFNSENNILVDKDLNNKFSADRKGIYELLKRNKSFDVERKNKYEYSKDISKLRLFQVLFSLEEDNLITHTNEEYGIIFKIKEGILYG